MADRFIPLSTKNKAEMIATGISGHKTPDRYATGDSDMKKGWAGGIPIDDRSVYMEDTPEDECM